MESGTSMAAPRAAGAIALMMGANRLLDQDGVGAILVSTAVDLDAPGLDNVSGAGRIDARAAVEAALASALAEDLDGSGTVDAGDVLMLIAAWGPCAVTVSACIADLGASGAVDAADYLILLAAWGMNLP